MNFKFSVKTTSKTKPLIRNAALLMLLFFAFQTISLAQDTGNDAVFLKNGGIIKGKVEFYFPDSVVRINSGSQTFDFKKAEIDRVEIGTTELKVKKVNSEIPPGQKGICMMAQLGFNMTRAYYSVNSDGNSSIFLGHHLNPNISAGITVGMNSYNNDNILMYPLGGQITGFFPSDKKRLWWSASGGYSPLTPNNDDTSIHYKGGLFLNPEVGYRFRSPEKLAFTISIGEHFQNMEKKYHIWSQWGNGGDYEQHIRFQRTVVKVGLIF